MLLEHIDRKDQIVRRPRHAVAPLDTGANIDRDLAVVLVETVPCRDPRHQLGVGAIAVEKVEWLVEELITDARNTTRHEGIERIVILDLAAAGIVLGTIGNQRAVARYVF